MTTEWKSPPYIARAQIRWIGRAANPNKPLPTGERRWLFYHAALRPGKEAWDIRVNFSQSWSADKTTIAEVGFTSPEAPKELLAPGNRFGLWDGDIVAEGEVLSYLSDRTE